MQRSRGINQGGIKHTYLSREQFREFQQGLLLCEKDNLGLGHRVYEGTDQRPECVESGRGSVQVELAQPGRSAKPTPSSLSLPVLARDHSRLRDELEPTNQQLTVVLLLYHLCE